MDRRQFTFSCLGAGLGAVLPQSGIAAIAAPSTGGETSSSVSRYAEVARRDNKRHIAFLVYDGMTLLDLVGPMETLSNANFDVDFVSHNLAPVYAESRSNKRLGVLPTATFAELAQTDILFCPGSSDPLAPLQQPELIDWVAKVGAQAEWVTSVCSGAMILGAAGLLNGYKATSHWGWLDKLRYFGAKPTQARVVHDRNRVTGAGVTSGIDFGLVLLSLLLDETTAKVRQLGLEYDPQPPFACGSVAQAPTAMVAQSRSAYQAFLAQVEPQQQQLLEGYAAKLKVSIRG